MRTSYFIMRYFKLSLMKARMSTWMSRIVKLVMMMTKEMGTTGGKRERRSQILEYVSLQTPLRGIPKGQEDK